VLEKQKPDRIILPGFCFVMTIDLYYSSSAAGTVFFSFNEPSSLYSYVVVSTNLPSPSFLTSLTTA